MLDVSRRLFLGASLAGIAAAAIPPALARTHGIAAPIAPALLQRAYAALQRHGASIVHRDVMGIADFSQSSKAERFFLLNLGDGRWTSHLVAHGRGSDPEHTGWLERFSNEMHSNATSAGAFRTGDPYVGGHGHSIHLTGPRCQQQQCGCPGNRRAWRLVRQQTDSPAARRTGTKRRLLCTGRIQPGRSAAGAGPRSAHLR